ncbi:MAG TPA: NAD-dependent succinate-semialdehyde dehydrogenase [Marinagarivorans sp.]
MLIATDPTTGERLCQQPPMPKDAIDKTLSRAQLAFEQWQTTSFAERAEVLNRVAEQLRQQKSTLAGLMAQEMGKPIAQGQKEVEKAAWCAEFYAEHAEQYLAREALPSDASLSYVRYQPLGLILGILPWNMPVWLAFRYCVPALMAGNTCVMKHDSNTPQTAQAIADVFAAVAPEGILVNLPIESSAVADVIEDPRIAAVSFTGSSAAGRKVAAAAGGALKRCVLELGGSDPCVIFADADMEEALATAVKSRINNSGQSCIAAKRILVERSAYDAVIEKLKARLQAVTVGNPLLPDTDVGPIARKDLRDKLHQQVQDSISAGANCLLGGELPSGAGSFYPVTLLTDITPTMPVFTEETFGPVMCVTPFDDQDHALQLANQTEYGLGGSVWTTCPDTATLFAERIVSGQVAVNGLVKTDPRLPSGGVKHSGFGRELGPHGIREFVNIKQVWIK